MVGYRSRTLVRVGRESWVEVKVEGKCSVCERFLTGNTGFEALRGNEQNEQNEQNELYGATLALRLQW
jgi:hypothetical protein